MVVATGCETPEPKHCPSDDNEAGASEPGVSEHEESESEDSCGRDLAVSEPAPDSVCRERDPSADVSGGSTSEAEPDDAVWEELRRARLRFIHAARRIGWFQAPPVPHASSSGSNADSASDTGPEPAEAGTCEHGSSSDPEADSGSGSQCSSESSSHWDEFEASRIHFIQCAQRAGWYDLVRYRHLLGPRPDMVIDRDVLTDVSPRREAADRTVMVSRSASSGRSP